MWIGNDSSHCFTAMVSDHLLLRRSSVLPVTCRPWFSIWESVTSGDQHPSHLCTEVFVLDAQASNAAALEPEKRHSEETSGRGVMDAPFRNLASDFWNKQLGDCQSKLKRSGYVHLTQLDSSGRKNTMLVLIGEAVIDLCQRWLREILSIYTYIYIYITYIL